MLFWTRAVFVPNQIDCKRYYRGVARSRYIFYKVSGVPGGVLFALFPPSATWNWTCSQLKQPMISQRFISLFEKAHESLISILWQVAKVFGMHFQE